MGYDPENQRHIFNGKHKTGEQDGGQHHAHHGNQHGGLLGIGNIRDEQTEGQTGDDKKNALGKDQQETALDMHVKQVSGQREDDYEIDNGKNQIRNSLGNKYQDGFQWRH